VLPILPTTIGEQKGVGTDSPAFFLDIECHALAARVCGIVQDANRFEFSIGAASYFHRVPNKGSSYAFHFLFGRFWHSNTIQRLNFPLFEFIGAFPENYLLLSTKSKKSCLKPKDL
jgi:hypothetical protein